MDIRALEVVQDLDRHVAGDGWEQPPRLFAIAVPETDTPQAPWRAFEQPWDADGADLVADLDRIQWPETVAGAAITAIRVLESGEELRLTTVALRNGETAAAIRYRGFDTDDAVGYGPNLAPEVQRALFRTLNGD